MEEWASIYSGPMEVEMDMNLTSDEEWVVDRLVESPFGLTFSTLRENCHMTDDQLRKVLSTLIRSRLVTIKNQSPHDIRSSPIYRLVTNTAGFSPVHRRPLFDGEDVTMYGVVAQEACEVIFKLMILRLLQECDPTEVERIATQAVRKIIADAS